MTPRPLDQTSPRLRAFDQLARVSADRGRVYRWLAALFYPPDEELLRALTAGALVEEIAVCTVWLGNDQLRLASDFRRLCGEFSLADLQREYERLFGRSVDHVSPRESSYRWRDASSLLGNGDDVARAVRQRFGQYGLTPRAGQEDHVAVELEFLACLCQRESERWQAGLSESARQLRREERAFLDDHLGRWLSEFAARVRERSASPLYSHAARLADTWLSLEHGPGYLPAASVK